MSRLWRALLSFLVDRLALLLAAAEELPLVFGVELGFVFVVRGLVSFLSLALRHPRHEVVDALVLSRPGWNALLQILGNCLVTLCQPRNQCLHVLVDWRLLAKDDLVVCDDVRPSRDDQVPLDSSEDGGRPVCRMLCLAHLFLKDINYN